MTNYEFGKFVYSRCYVAQVRDEILKEMKNGGPCEAIEGFVDTIRERITYSNVDRRFLYDYEELKKCAEAFKK